MSLDYIFKLKNKKTKAKIGNKKSRKKEKVKAARKNTQLLVSKLLFAFY